MSDLNSFEQVEYLDQSMESENLQYLYDITFEVVVKEFFRQKGTKVGNIRIYSNNVEDLKKDIWQKINSHIQMKITPLPVNLPEDYDPSAGYPSQDFEVNEPQEMEIDKFCAINEPTTKRLFMMNNITTNHLHAWTTKPELSKRLYVYKYSSEIQSAADFKEVQHKVLRPSQTDRAGAVSNEIIAETVTRLKATHGHMYKSHYHNWQLLATKICRENNPSTSPASYERAIIDGPGTDMIHLFAVAFEEADHNLNNVRQNVSIGISINNDVSRGIATVLNLLDKLQEKRKEEDVIVDQLLRQIEALNLTANATSRVLSDVQDAHSVAEHPYGTHISTQVTDAPDNEHM